MLIAILFICLQMRDCQGSSRPKFIEAETKGPDPAAAAISLLRTLVIICYFI